MIRFPVRRAAFALAGITLLACGVALEAGREGSARLPLLNVSVLEIAAGHDRVAERWLDDRKDPARFEKAKAESEAALRQSPYDTGALLRLAYIDRIEDGRLDRAGVEALVTSYDRVAFDPAVARWRIQFALENWEYLPVKLRQRVQEEVFAVASEPGHRWPLRIQLKNVQNPYGVMVAAFWQLRVQRMQEVASNRGAPAPQSSH